MTPRIAISLGDPAGIGPEITIKCLKTAKHICRPTLFGHWPTFAQTCQALNYSTDDIQIVQSGKLENDHSVIRFVEVPGPDLAVPAPNDDAARIQLNALAAAVTAIQKGHCDALVTAPVSKALIARIEPDFTGHTEYLAQRAGLAKDDVTMVFANTQLVVGLISTHIPLVKIPLAINEKTYARTLRHVVATVKQTGKTATPRIGVAGLNPHAGEEGLLGTEEVTFIGPFCQKFNGLDGARITGPVPADAVFRDAFAGKYDGVIAAYHDQALIPLKLGGFGGATNVTAGLPFIRTSPDHGTAYEIAGQNIADASAMKSAIEMAVRLLIGKQTPAD
ncbi:MAG: 4-hydroxythreonine-4-phosphate dehydrogenase PdxA [Deltaproteobacteria bacterium]|nr:4-hydroxythreonine-4-phosphate dehydrogenase PdxA [Deltaproteobacteria bacterium]